MKKNLGWITMAAVVATSPLSQARAGEDAVPFQACKNVVVKSQKEYDERIKKGCAAALEVAAPGIGDSLKTSATYAGIGKMLGDVAKDQYLKDLEKKIKYWEDTKACFKSSSADCKKKVNEIKSAYGGFVGSLRTQLARANVVEKDGKTVASGELKSFGSGSTPFLPKAFPDAVSGSLQPSELQAVNEELKKMPAKRAKIVESAQVDYYNTVADGIQKNGLYLVAYLPKPSSASASGSPEWSDDQWGGTIDRLIQDAKHEVKVTDDAINSNTVSFPVFGTRDLVPGWDKDKRDLMYYATLTPEMEKYLTKHPEDCGLAVAATKWMSKMEYQKMGAAMGSMFIGGAGAGGAATAFRDLTMLGKGLALTSAVSGGWIGGVMTYNDYRKNVVKADDSFKQLAKIGVEKGKEVDVIDPKQYAEAQEAADHAFRNAALAGTAFFVGGHVGGKAVEALAKAYVSKSPSVKSGLARLFIKSREPEKLAQAFEKEVPSQYRATLGANLADPEVQHQLMLSKAVAKDLKEMEADGTLKGPELEQVEDLLAEKESSIARNLELQGKCKGEACHPMAADEAGGALKSARKSCPKGT